MQLNLQATKVFEDNWLAYEEGWRIILNEGGARSSKTYSIAEIFLILLCTQKDTLITVCRKTLPALKQSAMRDFFDIMKAKGLYNEKYHNKTENFYKYQTNEIEFISVDEPMKIRGRKRRFLWMNEANEFTFEDYRQLILRTEGQIWMDYNPSDQFHWIYDKVAVRDDCKLIRSTFLDNTFLEPAIRREIELLKDTDENYWRIFGLGLRGATQATIYNHWQLCDQLPDEGENIYGLDFGFNNQTALVRGKIKDEDFYVKELIYETHLTNSQLIDRLIELAKSGDLNYDDPIYADAAEPQRIQEICDAGFNCISADKDVKKGIDDIRSKALFITKDSPNLHQEAKSYKFKQKDDIILEEPVKFKDHLMDAMRYARHTHNLQNSMQPSVHFL